MRARFVGFGVAGALVALVLVSWRVLTRGLPSLVWAACSLCAGLLCLAGLLFCLVVVVLALGQVGR